MGTLPGAPHSHSGWVAARSSRTAALPHWAALRGTALRCSCTAQGALVTALHRHWHSWRLIHRLHWHCTAHCHDAGLLGPRVAVGHAVPGRRGREHSRGARGAAGRGAARRGGCGSRAARTTSNGRLAHPAQPWRSPGAALARVAAGRPGVGRRGPQPGAPTTPSAPPRHRPAARPAGPTRSTSSRLPVSALPNPLFFPRILTNRPKLRHFPFSLTPFYQNRGDFS